MTAISRTIPGQQPNAYATPPLPKTSTITVNNKNLKKSSLTYLTIETSFCMNSTSESFEGLLCFMFLSTDFSAISGSFLMKSVSVIPWKKKSTGFFYVRNNQLEHLSGVDVN
jgi:hypothetical protein